MLLKDLRMRSLVCDILPLNRDRTRVANFLDSSHLLLQKTR